MLSLAQAIDVHFRLDETLGFALRQALQHHHDRWAASLPDGLTTPQFAVLARLLELGSCSQNQLGRLALMDAATTKGVIDRLRARGLVASAADATDRRRLTVSLTEAGRALAEAALTRVEAAEADARASLSAREQTALLGLLRKICQ